LFFFLHAVAFSCVFGAWAFYVPGEQRSAMERAFYGGLHRAGWGVSIGWLIIACSLDLAGKIWKTLHLFFFSFFLFCFRLSDKYL
jgi:hypothetical protein